MQGALIFDVAYTADDATSGMDSVELFFNVDGGDYASYGSFTESPIAFTAAGDGEYGFYTVAVDAVGNVEAIPDSPPDAPTIVETGGPVGTFVIAGGAAAVTRAIEVLKERGARRALLLPVSAPFHSTLMAPAREGLAPTLRELEFRELTVPLYRNIDAAAVSSPDEVRDGLIRQVDAPVLWSETIRRMRADGFDTFVEVGTGKVLSGLVRRIDRDAVCYQAGTVETVEKVIAELVG